VLDLSSLDLEEIAGALADQTEEHPGLLPAWYAFRDTRASRRAVQWLADNSLIDDGSANSFFSGHPDPALP
jgi:hypothetical protein